MPSPGSGRIGRTGSLRSGYYATRTTSRYGRARAKNSDFEIERVENGTNIFRVKVGNVNAPVYQGRLEQSGIVANVPVGDRLVLQVNETWNRVPAEEIAARFKLAMG